LFGWFRASTTAFSSLFCGGGRLAVKWESLAPQGVVEERVDVAVEEDVD
jgi:hypothetical protein